MATIDVAMESSVQAVKTVADNIYAKVDTEVGSVVTNTATNNTASKTGVLSAKLAYVISLLENTTYGLSALKTASGSSAVKSVQRGIASIGSGGYTNITISAVNTSKTFVNIQPFGSPSEDFHSADKTYGGGGRLTSSTNLYLSSYSDGKYFAWEVIEFK